MIRGLLGRAREWAGDKLVTLGLRVLGADTKVNFEPPPVIGVEPEDEPYDINEMIPAARVSAKGLAMITDAENARRWQVPSKPAPNAPLEGSLQDRVARERRAAGE